MLNKYAGKCQRCGQEVAPGKGTLEKRGEKWVVTHVNCNGTSTAPPKPAPVPAVEGEWSIERRSVGKGDGYEVGRCTYFARSRKYGVIVEAGKYRDDDTDEWMCTARVRPAEEAEIAPVRARIEAAEAAQAAADELAGALRESKIEGEIDARLFERPSDAVHIWAQQRSVGSERWTYSPSTDTVYYTVSSWDDGPATWATTSTRAQVEALRATGLYRPSLLKTE